MSVRRAPGVEHGGDTDASAEMFGVGRDCENGLARGLEQQIVDHRFSLIARSAIGAGDVIFDGEFRRDSGLVSHFESCRY